MDGERIDNGHLTPLLSERSETKPDNPCPSHPVIAPVLFEVHWWGLNVLQIRGAISDCQHSF